MGEAELIDAYISASELAVQTMMFYLTIVTGYVVVAHFAGATLLTRQIVFVNSIFVVFGFLAVWGSVGYFTTASHFWLQTAAYAAIQDEEFLGPAVLVGSIESAGILASLLYMRDIRSRALAA